MNKDAKMLKGGKMKVVAVMGILLVALSLASAGYCGTKQNASPAIVELVSSTASKVIIFNPPTEDLIIHNNNEAEYVYIDLKSTTNGIGWPAGTFDKARCFKLGPQQSLEFYGFVTDGLTIYADGISVPSSPISVLAIN